MTIASIASGTAVFVDANIFVYAFAPDPQFGPACEQLLERIELHDLQGFTTSHVLADVAHRLMSLEACADFGWPYAGIAVRMRSHPPTCAGSRASDRLSKPSRTWGFR